MDPDLSEPYGYVSGGLTKRIDTSAAAEHRRSAQARRVTTHESVLDQTRAGSGRSRGAARGGRDCVASAQQTPTPPTTQGNGPGAKYQEYLNALANHLNIPVSQLQQAMQEARQDVGLPQGPGPNGGPGPMGFGPGGRGPMG